VEPKSGTSATPSPFFQTFATSACSTKIENVNKKSIVGDFLQLPLGGKKKNKRRQGKLVVSWSLRRKLKEFEEELDKLDIDCHILDFSPRSGGRPWPLREF
jgi:hypothetical protein